MKSPASMSLTEASNAFHNLDDYFCSCRDNNQGISSKDITNFSLLADHLTSLGQGTEEFSLYFNHTAEEHCITHATQIDTLKRLQSQCVYYAKEMKQS